MREIITSTGASLFTAAVLVAQTLASGPAPAAVPVHAAAPAIGFATAR